VYVSDVKRIWANLFIRAAMRQQKRAYRLAKPNLDIARRLAAVNRFLTPYTTLVAVNDDLSRSRFGYHELVSQLIPAVHSQLNRKGCCPPLPGW
jgi:hypothetical protein